MSDFFVHPQGLCESQRVGKGTRVWAFAHVLPGAVLGSDCNICDHTFIENDVVVGDRVTVKCGVQLWDGVRLEDDVFVGPNATFTNDHFPRSKQRPAEFLKTVVSRGASIGANATVLPGVSIGQNAMVGAGAVVTHNVPPNAIVVGNPARIVGYVDTGEAVQSTRAVSHLGAGAPVQPTRVPGVTLHRLKLVKDMRGSLSVGEYSRDIPFVPQRYFLVFDVPSAEVRGEHAHYKCHQFLICAKGQVSVVADDGTRREEYRLDSSDVGIYLPPMVWGIQYRYSADAVLLVFASDPYDPKDYIRDYDQFLAAKAAR
ncbi:MAG TPA: WxcM-like domain-containing protein [Polyangiaceae bacterium]|jgi:acetyltransferase-like isoleucine patch superfamily enzyme/dTDP-4-dehydrorhamnose 3,5-epimerase-like enzyme|nr:WxcM-like domain-containing protein [Polyangiaceae bacterium]